MITVFGSIGMDLLFNLPHLAAVGETVLTPAYTTAIGGKGANQAVAAARVGVTVRFVGSVGAAISLACWRRPWIADWRCSLPCGERARRPVWRVCWSVPHRACRPEWQSI
jgi:hypothetical protein